MNCHVLQFVIDGDLLEMVLEPEKYLMLSAPFFLLHLGSEQVFRRDSEGRPMILTNKKR
jgi:hypothetical protein